MSLKKYEGSCDCGKVRFEADIDLSKGTSRCNCLLCSKARSWVAIIKPQAFRLLEGNDALTDYLNHGDWVGFHDYFCKSCGVRTHGAGNIPQIGGEYVAIKVSTLDNITPEALAEIPIRYMDGRHDNWMESPKTVAYL